MGLCGVVIAPRFFGIRNPPGSRNSLRYILLTLVPHITMMLASNVRRLASRAAPRISFSTGATIRSSPSSRSMTPLLAVAGVAAFSMALAASREVRA